MAEMAKLYKRTGSWRPNSMTEAGRAVKATELEWAQKQREVVGCYLFLFCCTSQFSKCHIILSKM